MASVPDRKTLEGMKRVELQRLCKDHGLRANLKSEALIELLLETTGPQESSQTAQPKRSSSMRIVSKASNASRRRDRSGGSMIIHDTDEEEEGDNPAPPSNDTPHADSRVTDPPMPTTRSTRKAKETQIRLGVGRPLAAGGSGPRAVTRSTSLTKGRRGKTSRSVKPIEATIQEEEEEAEPNRAEYAEFPEAGPSGTPHDLPLQPTFSTVPWTNPESVNENRDVYFTTLINPLREQLAQLQAELQLATTRLSGVGDLERKVAELTMEVNTLRDQAAHTAQLENEVSMLKEFAASFKAGNLANPAYPTPPAGSSGKSRAITQTEFYTARSAPSEHPEHPDSNALYPGHPGFAAPLLGKRTRDSKDSNLTGVIEADQQSGLDQEQLATQVIRPTKKRAKLAEGSSDLGAPAGDLHYRGETAEALPVDHGPGFTVFTGPEDPEENYVEPPPPTTRLSELLGLTSTPGPNSVSPITTSTATGNENLPVNHAFNFSFFNNPPLTSTPAGHVNADEGGEPFHFTEPPPSLPEPPASPTPGSSGAGPNALPDRRRGRDMYGNLGRGSVSRPSVLAAPPSRSQPSIGPSTSSTPQPTTPHDIPEQQQFINPTDLMRPGTPQRHSAVPEGGLSNRPISAIRGIVSALPPETPAPPVKKTMYGTELDSDTRFGDFGVEGVATGFWTGTGPPF
ncbi:hypothetical protein K474DRAFT_1694476 [Panus rudis PR-1116 ss-1]|nr:hypothetical protein K474DRAFT_1694476 [Panus rudis PR-1116 ss-1]